MKVDKTKLAQVIAEYPTLRDITASNEFKNLGTTKAYNLLRVIINTLADDCGSDYISDMAAALNRCAQ